MGRLTEARARARDAVAECVERPFFLRLNGKDDALWVSDLPRLSGQTERAEDALGALGIVCRLEPCSRLWRMDWTAQRYAMALEGLPARPPGLPKDASLHPAYALCRLMLLHFAPLDRQPMDLVRRVFKLCEGPRGVLLNAVPGLHAECAALLRHREALPHAAGRVLAEWLEEQAEEG